MSAGLDSGTGRYRRVIRHIKTTSKRQAKAALVELESAVARGRVSFDDPTVSNLLDRWLEHIAGFGRSATTLYHYRQYVDREIVPVLGGIRLSKLSTLEIDELYTKLPKRGLAPGDDPPDPCHLARFAEPRPSDGGWSSGTWPSWHLRLYNHSASSIPRRSPMCER